MYWKIEEISRYHVNEDCGKYLSSNLTASLHMKFYQGEVYKSQYYIATLIWTLTYKQWATSTLCFGIHLLSLRQLKARYLHP